MPGRIDELDAQLQVWMKALRGLTAATEEVLDRVAELEAKNRSLLTRIDQLEARLTLAENRIQGLSIGYRCEL